MKREPPHIDPTRSSLVIVDMQKAFLEPDGVMFVPQARAIVPAVRSTVEFCRAQGIEIVWTRMSHEGMACGAYPELFPGHFLDDGTPRLCRGSRGFEIVDELEPAPGEVLINKLTYSSFGRTNLESILRRDGRDTVIIAGIATNVCVESTAREAFALGFRVVVLSDAVSTGNAEAHAASLRTLSLAFGWVITTSQLRECMVNPRES